MDEQRTESPATSFRFPPAVLHALDAYCARTGQRRSTAVRDAVVTLLREAGCWPPRTGAPLTATGKGTNRKPRPITIGDIHARVIRGPDAEGLWYWQAVVYGNATERTVWSGWATMGEARRALDAEVVNLDIDRRNHIAGKKLMGRT